MNALLICFFAACFASLSNLFFRKSTISSNNCDNTNGYLLIYYFFSFFFSIALDRTIIFQQISYPMLFLGGLVGIFNVILMILTSKAFKAGPVGLTLAFQNGSSVFPGLLLFVVFGSNFDFSCSLPQLMGIGLVLCGLFLGAFKKNDQSAVTKIWVKYALLALGVQILALMIIQGRCILFSLNNSFAVSESADIWFLPGQFGVSFLLQTFIFMRQRQNLELKELLYGGMGGIANFGASVLLLLATKGALSFEKTLIFPCFAVSVILICNLWAKHLYKEKFDLPANSTCALGIVVGSL